jgi:geranylgeranyl diphosphate synthase, type I
MATLDAVTVGRRSGEVGQALLRRARADCDAVLHKVIRSMREPFATMAGYHLGWWNTSRCAMDGSSGKALRAALVFAAAAACGGDAGDAAVIAAAVELMHNFTLLHDDVMDGDATRRGRPTVWSVWGVNSAIVLGDALHATAIRTITDLPDQCVAVRAARRLEASCVDLCIGQFEDCSFEGRQGVTVDDYVRMAADKTASLIGCSCALGALSANADEATIAAFERFGYELGLAFQFVDDLIGIWGDPSVTGKPVGSDLARRKATLPVVAALNSQSEAATELAALYRTTAAMTPSDIDRAAALVEGAGGRCAASRYADERVQAAIAVLPDAVRSEDLIALSQLIARRDR